MCANDDVGLASFQVGENALLFFIRLKAAQRVDLEWKVSQTFAESSRVLVGEDRRRDQDDDLPARLNSLERGPDGNLGLPVTNVPDQEAIHRTRLLHVALDVSRRRSLIGSVLEQKRGFELTLPDCIRQVRRTSRDL